MEIGYHDGIPVYDVRIPNENWTIAYLLRDIIDPFDNVDSVSCDMVHPTSETNTVKLQIRMHTEDVGKAAKRLSKHLLKDPNVSSTTVYVRRKKKHDKSFYADRKTPRLYGFKASKTLTPVTESMVKLAKERGYQHQWKMGDSYEKVMVQSHNLTKRDILGNLKELNTA